MLKRVHTFGLCAVLALIVLSDAFAQGVPQAFTFQGFLRQGTAPFGGTLPMVFRIFDASAGGTLVWQSTTISVTVNSGLFTVTLDPPASVWTGAPRFLEVQIIQGSTTITLSPRIPINPTPYANTATLLNMFQGGTTNPDRMVITHSPPFTNWGLQYRDSDDSFHFLGNGISRLSINLNTGVLQYPRGAAAGRVLTSDASGNASWADLPASATVWAVSGNNIYNTNTGNVGVGTNTPAYLLDVRGDRNERLINIANTNTGTLADGLRVEVSGSSAWGLNSVANGADGIAVRGAALGANAWAGFFIGRGHFSGNVGIGTASLMTARLNVAADSTLDNATLRLHETANDVARLEFTNTNTARKWHIAGYIGTGTNANADSIAFWNSGYPSYGGNIMRIRGDGTVEVRVLEITGADLAEKFPVTDTVEPGMVVEIDPDNPGNLRKARGAYNKRVVGVAAGANGLSKGIILGSTEGSESHMPIAISGRVWVYADATERAIEPGDFLTTAERPGYAMKADDLAKAQGAIIGKAMTRLEKGKTGMVLVLVNLQ
ncbi:MAG: hypothetical protein RMK45_05745 [Armatimonadota bacterium]|nr:hypothetical protein [Armatimonadota bacterium]